MRCNFYRDLEGKLYKETEYNLKVFVKWLGSKLDEICNPIAVITKSEERKKHKKEQKSSNKSNLPKDSYIYQTLSLNEDSKKDNKNKTNFPSGFAKRITK